MEQGYSAYVPSGVNRAQAYLSPLRAPNLRGLALALVITGEFDVLRDEGEAYARRLQGAGVPVALTRYPGMVHGFFQSGGELDGANKLIGQIAAQLKRDFGSRSGLRSR